MVRPIAVLASGLAVLVCAVPAAAQEPPEMRGHAQKASPAGPLLKKGAHASASRLWATVNMCDTERRPDAMGVRASMPGNGTRQQMYMRFSVQWYSGEAEDWLDVPGGVSPWQRAGSARFVARQAGYTFNFVTPPAGRGYLLRGSVEFQWRKLVRPQQAKRDSWSSASNAPAPKAHWKVAKRNSIMTRTGVKGVDGGDPAGTSKAICLISNPAS